jgi:hypothetical protein
VGGALAEASEGGGFIRRERGLESEDKVSPPCRGRGLEEVLRPFRDGRGEGAEVRGKGTGGGGERSEEPGRAQVGGKIGGALERDLARKGGEGVPVVGFESARTRGGGGDEEPSVGSGSREIDPLRGGDSPVPSIPLEPGRDPLGVREVAAEDRGRHGVEHRIRGAEEKGDEVEGVLVERTLRGVGCEVRIEALPQLAPVTECEPGGRPLRVERPQRGGRT